MAAPSDDTLNRIVINGCDLLNRHELSKTQDRELQRFIDNNAHLLSFKDREPPPQKRKPRSRYAPLSRSLSHGESPLIGYNRTDYDILTRRSTPSYNQCNQYNQYSSSRGATPISNPFVTPTGQRVNFTCDFPGFGDGSRLDDGFAPVYRPSSATSPYGTLNTNDDYNTLPSNGGYGGYGTMTSNGGYSTLGKGGIKHSRPPSPYNSLKRKGVSWLDQERARSLSPNHRLQQHSLGMSQYGSAGNLQYGSAGNLSPFRDRTASPAYSALDKHKDDYNRFETARHKEAMRNERQKSEESRFQAFGDRPGSGVDLSGHHWEGGEIITDPSQLPRSLKPRRLYYSPIGDGTVAADGIELRRRPPDLSPRVTITQMQHVDRGSKGHDGLNVYEKSWVNPLGSQAGSEAGYGSEYGGPGSGRNSRAGALSPSGDPYGKGGHGGSGPHGAGLGGPGGLGGLGGPGGPGALGGLGGSGGYGAGGPGVLGGPGAGGGYGSGRGTPIGPVVGDGYSGPGTGGYGGPGTGGYGGGPGSGRPGSGMGGRDPYGTLDSRSGHPYGSNGNLGPGNDGRTSVASSVFSDPSYRFDTKTGYLITNPRELIHQYATTTPVAVMEPTDNTPSTTTITKQSLYRRTEETTEEQFSPYAPYKSAANVPSPNKFVRQLRDETMTNSQREANTHLDPLNQRDAHADQRIGEIRSKTNVIRGHDDIDNLTQQLVHGLQTSTRY